MNKSVVKYVLISCCTCKRPNMLRQSLLSIKELILPENLKVELLVIDNDKEATATSIIEELQKDFPLKINYFVEEQRGISNARNRLLKESLELGASHIALFDDDEILDSNWLISHFNYYNENEQAIIVSGSTYNKFQKKYPKYIEKNNIFKQSTTKKTGLIRNTCASGNVFFPTTIMSESNIYFDNSFIYMGGEDGAFFSCAAKQGFTIVWNNDAVNYEIINDERANTKWILDRSYYNGYSGTLLKFKENKKVFKKVLFIIKTFVVFLIDCALVLPSLILGLTTFFNMLAITYKTKGKIDAAINDRPLNYYQNICGN